MCSVLPEADDLQKRIPEKIGSLCTKCSETAVLVIRGIDPLCRSCFLPYFIHKFRAAFGKSKLIHPGEKVLIAYSGGPASTSLVHLIFEGLKDQHHKKLRFSPSIVIIEEGVTSNISETERLKRCQEVIDSISYSNFTCYLTTLEKVFELSDSTGDFINIYTILLPGNKLSHLPTNAKLISQIKQLLESVESLTAKLDLIEKFRHQLVYKIAKHIGHTKVLFGESATRLAVKVLANIAQGRGAHLPLDVNFVDTRFDHIIFLRPMRELSSKEIGFYNTFQDLHPIVHKSLFTGTFQNSCIQRLTESFVYNLQSEFFSTVSTIVRTGDKLCLNEDSEKIKELCLLCQAPIDTNTSVCSALLKSHLTQASGRDMMVDVAPFNTVHCDRKDCDDDCFVFSNIRLTLEQLNQYLCYGCRIILRDMRKVESLPEFIQERACTQLHRSQMKEQIKDFLLQDDNDSVKE